MHSKNNQYEIKQSKYASFCFVIYNNKRNMKIFSLKRCHFEIYTIFYVTIYYTEEKKGYQQSFVHKILHKKMGPKSTSFVKIN